jgi:hypothetical protein
MDWGDTMMKISLETLRTFRNACFAAAMMFSVLGAYASITGGLEPMRMEPEAKRFMSHGLDNTEARLVAELSAQFPAGSDAGGLLARLTRSGFECQADMAAPGNYACVFNRPLSFQRVARVTTVVETEGAHVRGIRPSVRVEPAPPPPPRFQFASL